MAEDGPKCALCATPHPLSQCRRHPWGPLEKSHFSGTQGCLYIPECFRYITDDFPAFSSFYLGFLAVLNTKMCAPQKQLPFEIQLFLLGRCERKLLWLRADYLPNEMLPFFWVRKCSFWSGMAACGLLRQHFSPCNPQMQHCWVIPCFVINNTISFLLDTADAQPMFFHRITSF